MEAGIIGLPYVGKTTLFSALTGQMLAEPEAGLKPNVGMVNIPDDRLGVLAGLVETEKVTPATMKLVDIAGLMQGSGSGESLGGRSLEQIRVVDALIHVVRCFEKGSVAHVDDALSPARDMGTVEAELILHDLGATESALPKTRKVARGGKDPSAAARLAVLEKMDPVLGEGEPARRVDIDDPEEEKALRGLGFLSTKEVLYVANVDDDDVAGEGPLAAQVHARAREEGMESITVCAQIDKELAELDETERSEMLKPLGLTEPAVNLVARAAYSLLGLQSFYTVGPTEIRAWTIRVGATAREAAGAIHSDLERGFIRAEVYSVTDLAELGTEKAIKEAGRMRVEGKDYVMGPEDVVHFLYKA